MTDTRIPKLSMLIVDDSRVLVKLLRAMLTTIGVTDLETASSADEAEEKMKQKRYDVVFLDWRMSGKSGVTLMEQCRADRAYDKVAFVIVSGEAGEAHIQEAMNAGATLYIVKPFNAEALRNNVDKVLQWLEERGRFAS